MEEMENNNVEFNNEAPTAENNAMPFTLPTEEKTVENPETPAEESKKMCKCSLNPVSLVIDLVLLLAVVMLFVLHFGGSCGKSNEIATVTPVACEPGTGEVYYVNLDSINECPYVKQQLDALEAEADKQEAAFNARQSKLQADYQQFQQNYQSGALTEQQAEYTSQKLQADMQKLQDDYQKAMAALVEKQQKQTKEMLGTIRTTVNAINTQSKNAPKASFVLTYSEETSTMFYVDPSRDMTKAVVEELGKLTPAKEEAKTTKK